ncbi:MAG: Uma2 family endonuclease [Gammaproteobacteria bacterium]|nr:Uma2 family endonuclease [Gammaproteobacteria bacterium]
MSDSPVGAVPSPADEREDFPGCDPVPMSWDDVVAHEAKDIWYWDGDTNTAWVVREITADHEMPTHRLPSLMTRISQERGSAIQCFGSASLVFRRPDGKPGKMMEPDQSVFLHPREPGRGDGIVLGRDRLPDVVMETDHTTDVRRRKLGMYERWGFPELWVEVPDAGAPSRPRGLAAGLTIYVLEGGEYRRVDASRAFFDWSAESIHVALNEAQLSRETMAGLARVGRELGRGEGTTPEDDMQTRGHRREAHRLGMRQGHAQGQAESQAKALAQQLEVLRRVASRRFDQAVVVRALGRLGTVDDVGRLTELGGLVFDCADGDELERRLAEAMQ